MQKLQEETWLVTKVFGVKDPAWISWGLVVIKNKVTSLETQFDKLVVVSFLKAVSFCRVEIGIRFRALHVAYAHTHSSRLSVVSWLIINIGLRHLGGSWVAPLVK